MFSLDFWPPTLYSSLASCSMINLTWHMYQNINVSILNGLRVYYKYIFSVGIDETIMLKR